MYSVSHGKMKTTEPGTDLKADRCTMGTAGGEPARWRLGRATAAQRLGFRQHRREDSGRAQQARLESSRNHRTKTNRSPAIGLRCRACRTVPEEHLLRPIVGEQLVLAKRSRENSGRAQQARLESSRNHCTKTNRSPAIGLRCRACRTVPEDQLLRPIVGERLVLAKRLRRDSERA